MNGVDTEKRTLRPTPGQLALAEALVDGKERAESGVSHIPASVYTDPEWFAREKAVIFDRLPHDAPRSINEEKP